MAAAISLKTAPGTMTTTTPRKGPPRDTKAHTHEVTNALVTLMSLNEPGALYDTDKAPDLQDVPVMGRCDPDAMVPHEQALKTQATHPSLTPILTRTGHQYRTTWVKGLPISHKSEVQVHVHHHLGVEGRLAAYELVGPKWQLNAINVHVPFGDATETFLEHFMVVYRQLAMMGPTVIIGDFNAAPPADNCGGRQSPRTQRCKWPCNTWACRTSQPLYEASPHTDHRIDLCYTDSAHVEVARAQYHDLPSKVTRHRPLEVQIKVLRVTTASMEDMDHEEQPRIRPPDEHDTHRWMAYYRTVQPILCQQDGTNLNLAMRQPATACSLHGKHRCARDDATPHQD